MENTKINTFRDEVAEEVITPAEEIRRNQAVHLIHLQSKKAMCGYDIDYLTSKIDSLSQLYERVGLLDNCECKDATLGIIKQQVEQHKKAIEASQFNGISEMTLDALERLAPGPLLVERSNAE